MASRPPETSWRTRYSKPFVKIPRVPFILFSVLLLVIVASGTLLTLNIIPFGTARAAADSAVLTYKGDTYRTGQYTNETILNKSNVNSSQFGKRVTYPVDGQVYAQPLFMPNLTINGDTHNVVIVVTEHDGVYAFDADQTTVTAPLWYTSFLSSGITPVPSSDVACNDMVPEVGITGTPVIVGDTIYLVAFTKENSKLVYQLHALDVTNGQEKPGSPQIITGSVPGKGSGNVNGVVNFDPKHERQRSALLFANGQLYIAFASFCDNRPYHGWIMSYNTDLQQTGIYNDTANGADGGIWGSGNALASDSDGNIYTITGNGDFDLNTGGVNAGDTFIKLSPQLKLLDYFAPFNQLCLEQADADLGSGGPLLIPGTNELVGAGKEGRIYVVNNSNMGKYTPNPKLTCSNPDERKRTDIDKVVQELPPGTTGGQYSTPALWNDTVYFTGAGDHIKAFRFNNGVLSTAPISQTADSFAFTGGGSVTSSNGMNSSTAVLWSIDPSAVLRAYDATNLSKRLYTSSDVASRDSLDSFVKFAVPTVANGEVFVGTKTGLSIFGLLPSTPGTPTATSTPPPTPTTPAGPPTFNNVGTSDDTNPGSGNFDGGHTSYSAQAIQNAGINPGDNTFYKGMVFTWPNAVPGQPNNYLVKGQTVPVIPIADANVLGFLGASTNGPSSGKATIHYTDGSTQAITLGFSDWTLGGGKNPLSFGNGRMAALPYRNTTSGLQVVTTYILYADVAMQEGKTVESVTLPSTTSGGQMHIFAIATKVGTVSTPVTPTIPYNNVATSDDGSPAGGSFDGINSYSSQATQSLGLIPGASVNVYSTTFIWPAVNPSYKNNYVAQGQVLPIKPVNNAGTLAFLGSSSYGPSSGTLTVAYTDGSTETFTLGFSDWTLAGGKASPSFNNLVAMSMPYRNTPHGKQNINTYIFYSEIPLAVDKTVQSITLPSDVKNGQLHVFAISTRTGSLYAQSPYNNMGTSNDNTPGSGNFDGGHMSYSAQALQSKGYKPGSVVVFNGTSFVWPASTPGTVDNYVAQGQVIPVNSVYNANYIAFLGSASHGPLQGNVLVTYTDGTTETVSLGFSDWTLGAGKMKPSYGNKVALTTTYRNGPKGKQNVATYMFYCEATLGALNKQVQSITLPTLPAGPGQLHIFAVATR
ncbi:hypothetical protein [Ktedonospora formicarum]|uniref:Pyrrolo-quinoline quinone n=1 Tax=Ktedonospora formicarum TaxID=2778364 RepID=A0A8J3HZW2_9CHLR|nr:hypothetical protein [Ktedonospora formicarum]GHO42324.1 hypothetical protein KSX_04870 [Ktedonospora formicarum]